MKEAFIVLTIIYFIPTIVSYLILRSMLKRGRHVDGTDILIMLTPFLNIVFSVVAIAENYEEQIEKFLKGASRFAEKKSLKHRFFLLKKND